MNRDQLNKAAKLSKRTGPPLLDEGETILNPLDVVIQRETNHAWQNLSTTEPALLLAVLVDTSAWK